MSSTVQDGMDPVTAPVQVPELMVGEHACAELGGAHALLNSHEQTSAAFGYTTATWSGFGSLDLAS